jgi:hypothetical protein
VGSPYDYPPYRPATRGRGAAPVLAGVALAAFVGGGAAGYLQGVQGRTQGPPPTPAPTLASTPARQPDAHSRLVERLPPAVYTGCTPQPEREGGPRVASVRCSSPIPGVDELLVTQWADPASMRSDFERFYGPKKSGRCGDYRGMPPAGRRSTWNGGPLACYVNDPGAAILLWEYPDLALQVVAVRSDHDHAALFAWWAATVPERPK